jgi:hypothetical protein
VEPKTPVLLLVLVETGQLRWFVASISLEGVLVPLLRSEPGDLEKYQGLDFDEQVAFLRHRFCGVLQRGCDRLWARGNKACQFVIVFEESLPEPSGDLTRQVAEHFAQWMLNPPVAVFVGPTGPAALDHLAGQLDRPLLQLLHASLGALRTATADPDAWELSRKKVS